MSPEEFARGVNRRTPTPRTVSAASGRASQFESFDFKPELQKMDKQPFPDSFTKGQQFAQLQNMKVEAMGPFVDFQKHGQSGQKISALFPQITRAPAGVSWPRVP